MWLGAKILPSAHFALPMKAALAGVLAAAGVCTGLVAVFQFKRARTTVHPMKPQEASTLVVRGIYRFTRNPMYLGVLLVLAGWAAWLANGVALVLLPCFVAYMNRFQIAPEERALEAGFGAAFAGYRRAVRRWL